MNNSANLDSYVLNLESLEGKLTFDSFKSDNLPENFINFCSLLARNAHFFQTRSKTGEPYSVHLDEVSGLGASCVKNEYKPFVRAQLRLHDWDEDAQKNKDVIYNLTSEQKRAIGLNEEEQHFHFSPLFTEFGLLGQFTAQTVRLFNKKLMLDYLMAINIVPDFITDSKNNKEISYGMYVRSLTGDFNFPTILGKQPKLNKDFHSFFLTLGKTGDLISNMDIGKPFNFNYQKRRLKLDDNLIENNFNKYVEQKRRNCLRVLQYVPLLKESLKKNPVSEEMLIGKNLDVIVDSGLKFADDYLLGKVEY